MILKGYESRVFESPAPKRYAYITGHDGNGRTQQVVLGKEHDYAQNVKEAACAVYAVARSDKPIFKLERGRFAREVIRPCKYGEQLMRALQLPFEDIEATLPQHYFNPLFTLLRQCRDRHVPDQVLLSHWKSLINSDAQALYGLLEALVADLREGLKNPDIARDLDSSRRRSDKRWKSVKKAICESTQDCSRLLAIRVDLHFHMATSLYPFAPTVSEDEAYGYMVKFERFLRDRYPLVRYLWSQEYGTQTGFHFHVLVLLNGHLVRDGVGIAMAMGEHWQSVITEGRGRYFNCNANEYRNPGLGVIERKNPAEVEALVDHVAWYLAKTDFWMRYKAAGRSFAISVRDRLPSAGGPKGKPQKGVVSAATTDMAGGLEEGASPYPLPTCRVLPRPSLRDRRCGVRSRGPCDLHAEERPSSGGDDDSGGSDEDCGAVETPCRPVGPCAST